MKRLTSVALAGVLAVATVATTLGSADAGWRGRGYYGGGCVGCGFAAGAVTGLALGAIATAPYRPYYRPYYYGAPAYYAPVAPRYYPAYAGNAHVDWCLANYRSYNPGTNTFIGYDGYAHICVGPY
jgi:hypothetical protein